MVFSGFFVVGMLNVWQGEVLKRALEMCAVGMNPVRSWIKLDNLIPV